MKPILESPTGITGFDELLLGVTSVRSACTRLRGRGLRQTLLAMTFLVNGVSMYGESGVFMSRRARIELVDNARRSGTTSLRW